MARRKKNSTSPTAATDRDRTLDDFAPSTIPTRSFFAGEYLRLARPLNIATPYYTDESGAKVSSVTLDAGCNIEYMDDVIQLRTVYYRCKIVRGGNEYYLLLTPDQIEVVRPT